MKATTVRTLIGPAPGPAPRVSIVTTVYDRVACLARCLRSVGQSAYADLEHLIVSDGPGRGVELAILAEVGLANDGRLRYLACDRRANDWGITPAAVGLRAARGVYVAFLSDDNAYLPEHLGPLVAQLDADPALGFVYASCRYAGRMTLNEAPPRGGAIDLGQPLFRRATLQAHFCEDLPFHEHAWDWRLIERLMTRGVPWHHHPAETFLFKADRYPECVP